MKVSYIIILNLLISLNSFGQSEDIFEIKEIVNPSLRLNKNELKKQQSNFFEDEQYIVSKTCSGEWGGTVRFKNKKTGIEYSCQATCPVAINKLDNKYIVTSTLAHLVGFSKIIEIENPDSMNVFQLPEPRQKKGKITIRYVGDDESKSTKGTKQLLDSIGVLTLASFPYNGQIFHIVTDFQKTYLARIENNKFINIGLLFNERIWTYDPAVIETQQNHFIVFFSNDKAEGHLDIFENKIMLIRYK